MNNNPFFIIMRSEVNIASIITIYISTNKKMTSVIINKTSGSTVPDLQIITSSGNKEVIIIYFPSISS